MQIVRTRSTFIYRIASVVMLAVLCVITVVPPASAQTPLAPHSRPAVVTDPPPKTVRQAIDATVFDADNTRFDADNTRKQSPPAPHAVKGQMHPAARAAIAAAGAFGGMIVGGHVGAFIEGDRCNCDDPGLKGALIGMPIGAVLAGVAAWKMTK